MSNNGYYSTVVATAPPATTAMATVADIKSELMITTSTDDAWIQKSIERISASIVQYCNHPFALQTWTETIRPSRGPRFDAVRSFNDPIGLKYWPLVSVTSITEVAVDGTATTLTLGTDYELDLATARLYRLDTYGQPCRWWAPEIIVVYQAGYHMPNDTTPNFPVDIEDACVRAVSARYKSRGRDPMMKSTGEPGVGHETYWIGTPGGGNLMPDVCAILDNYRSPVIS